MSKAFQAHLDAIAAGEVTKTNVTGLRKIVTLAAMADDGRWGLSASELKRLAAFDGETVSGALRDKRPRVVGGLHESGLAHLRNRRYRRQLEAVADIIGDIQSFHLIGFEMTGHRAVYATPIYEARDSRCRAFSFINIPWQAGGNGPEVLSGPYRV